MILFHILLLLKGKILYNAPPKRELILYYASSIKRIKSYNNFYKKEGPGWLNELGSWIT